MTNTLRLANEALTTIEEIINHSADKQTDISSYSNSLQRAWRKASDIIKALNEKEDALADIEECLDRLTTAKIKLTAILQSSIDQAIDSLERTGDKTEVYEFVQVAAFLEIRLRGDEDRRIGIATKRYDDYTKAKGIYQQSKQDLEIAGTALSMGSTDQASITKHKAEKALQNLKEIRAKFMSDESAISGNFRVQDIDEWVQQIEELLRPITVMKSIMDSQTVSGEMKDQWQSLKEALTLKLPQVPYFTNPDDPNDFAKSVMQPEEALRICESRWNAFSRDKFANYINEAKSELIDEAKNIYRTDPREILNSFTSKTERVLRPVTELDQDTRNKYTQFTSSLRAAIDITRKLEDRLNGIDIVNARLTCIGELDQLAHELKILAPFFLKDYEEKRQELVNLIRKLQEQQLRHLRDLFENNVKSAGSEATTHASQLKGFQEFSDLQNEFTRLAQFCQHVDKWIRRIEALPPQEANQEIAKLIEAIDQHKELPKPLAIIALQQHIKDVLEPAEQAQAVVTQAQAIITKFSEQINLTGELSNPSNVFFELEECLGRVCEILDALNQPGTNFIGAQSLSESLQSCKIQLEELGNWTGLYWELQKNGADLAKAQTHLQNLQHITDRILEYKHIQNLANHLGQLSAGDNQVRKVLQAAENTLTNSPSLPSLLNAWDQMETISNMATTLAVQRSQQKAELRARLQQQVIDHMHTFSQNPRGVGLELTKRVLAWHQRCELADNTQINDLRNMVQGSLYEAEAWQIIEEQPELPQYEAAYVLWKNAENANRPDAKNHRLALLKYLALLGAVQDDFRYLKVAINDPVLRYDIDICALYTKIEIDRVNQLFHDPEEIRSGKKIGEFERVKLNLANLMSWDAEDKTQTQDTFENVLVITWVKDGYQALMKNADAPHFPSANVVRQEAEYRQAVYTDLSAIFQRVDEHASLKDLHLARKAAVDLDKKKPWGKKAKELLKMYPELDELFSDQWCSYRDATLNKL